MPQLSLRVRVAKPEDVAAIERIVNFAYRGGGAQRSWTDESDLISGKRATIEEIQDLIRTENNVILVAEDFSGAEPVFLGSIHVENLGEEACLAMLAVDTTKQKGGVGRFLMGEAENYAKNQMGCRGVAMWAITQRPELVQWYLRQGYRDSGERMRFDSIDLKGSKPLHPDLTLSRLEKAFV